MAVQAQLNHDQELVARPPTDLVQLAAAKLYGQGYTRGQIAKILRNHLAPHDSVQLPEHLSNYCRRKLAKWEQQEEFRDLIYKHAVVKLDMETPKILMGLAGKAKRGRVDAARLALELTGRHNPKGDQAPTQVLIHVGEVPRPGAAPTTFEPVPSTESLGSTIEGEAEEITDG